MDMEVGPAPPPYGRSGGDHRRDMPSVYNGTYLTVVSFSSDVRAAAVLVTFWVFECIYNFSLGLN